MGKESRIRRERREAKRKAPYVIAGRIELAFTKEEWTALLEFQRAVNSSGEQALSLEHICKQSIYMTINRAYQQAQQIANSQGDSADGQTTGGVVTADNEKAPIGEDVAADLLA